MEKCRYAVSDGYANTEHVYMLQKATAQPTVMMLYTDKAPDIYIHTVRCVLHLKVIVAAHRSSSIEPIASE